MTTATEPTLRQIQQEITILRAGLKDANWQITQMQKVGGFADTKAISIRSTRIEARLEAVEGDVDMLKDVAGSNMTLLEDHLRDRHDADLNRDNSIDVTSFRKMRRRMHEWATKCGLIGKRSDVRQAMQDENRLRPLQARPSA